jgi:arginine/serine-rich splicing factor 12
MAVRLIQVSNISTGATKEQLRTLFAHLGRIEEIQLYPESETIVATISSKIGYIRFERSEIALAALNLGGTVFLDRSIICSIVKQPPQPPTNAYQAPSIYRIPDEHEALKYCPPINSNMMLLQGGPTWPHNVINRMINPNQQTAYIETIDFNLKEKSLPQYPHLPGTMDQTKAEEIRRTVYVSNIDPRVTFENLHDLFSQVGEIKYIRMTVSKFGIEYEKLGIFCSEASDFKIPDEVENIEDDYIGAYIEFSEQPSVVKALCLNGLQFAKRIIKVNHSMNSIVVPATVKEQLSLDDIKKEREVVQAAAEKARKIESRSSSKHKSSRHGKRRSGSVSSASTGNESSSSDRSDSPPRKTSRRSSSRHRRGTSRSGRSKSRDRHKESSTSKHSSSKKDRDRSRDRDRDYRTDRDRDTRGKKDERSKRSSSRGRKETSKQRSKSREKSSKDASSKNKSSRHRSKSKEKVSSSSSSSKHKSSKDDKKSKDSSSKSDKKSRSRSRSRHSSDSDRNHDRKRMETD